MRNVCGDYKGCRVSRKSTSRAGSLSDSAALKLHLAPSDGIPSHSLLSSKNHTNPSAMPRENRKRGKKHKKKPEEQYGTQQDQSEPLPEPQAGPSWIVPASNSSITAPTQEAPFGYVDAEIKAYFRTVDTQIRDWQEEGVQRADAGEEGQDPNEGKANSFLVPVHCPNSVTL